VANVRVDTSDAGVRTICIDREARRNALDRATVEELEAAFTAAGSDPRVRAIVLRGAGDRAFCAGADLAELQGARGIVESRDHFGGVARVMEAMQRAAAPVIARVAGHALAGGCGLAVAADLTIAAQSARFGLPEIGIGLLPLMVSAPIYRALGSRKALLDLVLTGRIVDGVEARALGLATRVVPDAELDGEIAALCERFASLSPAALRLGKEAIYTVCEMETGAAMRYLRDLSVLVAQTDDAREGIAAFFEKRSPVWKAR
jgi:enoyl-CoA hydratase/carnithine racemase